MAYIVTRTNSLKDGRVDMTMLDTEQGTAVDLQKLTEKNFGNARKPTWAEVELANGILEKRLRAHIGADDTEEKKELRAKQKELEVEKASRLRAEMEIKKLEKTLVQSYAESIAGKAALKFLELRGSDVVKDALRDYIQLQFDLDEYEKYDEAKKAYLVMTGEDYVTGEQVDQATMDRQKVKELLLELDKERVFDQEEMFNFFVKSLRERGFSVNL